MRLSFRIESQFQIYISPFFLFGRLSFHGVITILHLQIYNSSFLFICSSGQKEAEHKLVCPLALARLSMSSPHLLLVCIFVVCLCLSLALFLISSPCSCFAFFLFARWLSHDSPCRLLIFSLLACLFVCLFWLVVADFRDFCTQSSRTPISFSSGMFSARACFS